MSDEAKPDRRRWIFGGAGLAALGAGAWLATLGREPGPAATAAAADGLWARSFETPAGPTLAMASLRGKPLLINFWATWCAPCVREMPAIDRFYRDHAGKGVQVLGLAIDAPTPVREFLQKVKVGFPIGLAGLEGTELVRELGNERGGLPFSLLLDANGKVVQRKLGETSYDELALWAGALG
ncbi:MAG TPA: TlpA disulfide reductase family protein [Methylibium sp.]|uniref:TlpA disulfide reductase family protein n=1 Tax=Methylibium sp. TaxID=2067992 RepID=UPI002DBCA10D|nr:TlpA disulfide reductase family protein [Methylibium sp.]HEU4457934.1 TlpA disulfide reductase family protein [Methylibium sp.]